MVAEPERRSSSRQCRRRWSVDLVHDQLVTGRSLRILNVIDDVTKEWLAAVVDTSVSGYRVTRELRTLVARRGKPGFIDSAHGTDFISGDLDLWAYTNDVTLDFSWPRKPTEHGPIEAFTP